MAVGLVIVTLITYFNPLRMLARLPIDIDNLVVSGTKITMEQPRLSGFTRDARAYELDGRHRRAGSDQAGHRRVAQHPRQGGDAGQEFDGNDRESPASTTPRARLLKLDRRHSCSTRPPAIRATLSEALIDIRKGNIVSEHPVEVKMLQGTLNANRLEIVDSGDVMRFDGGVVMDMMLNQPAPPAPNRTRNDRDAQTATC